MMNYTGWEIPEGKVIKVEDADGRVIWMLPSSGKPVILQVEKITSDTYAGETTYTGEQFILLDIYPKTNGTVKVTYGGLSKIITDTSGAESPNAQQVFFGTFNGVTDEVETPASGTLTIEGDFYAFGCGSFQKGSKNTNIGYSNCITSVTDWGNPTVIPDHAFYYCHGVDFSIIPEGVTSIGVMAFAMSFEGAAANPAWLTPITSVTLPSTIKSIGNYAFSRKVDTTGSGTNMVTYYYCCLKTVRILATTPPSLGSIVFGDRDVARVQSIVVPKGCGDAYKAAEGWSYYANIIVEAS